MKKILVTSLGIVVIFLFILSLFSSELISKDAIVWDLIYIPGSDKPCENVPWNCASEGPISTPPN